MARASGDEIIQGYIEEVTTYIPSLIQGIESFRKTADREALEETHRLVHTIKGASAMVGIHGLSHIACQMEDTLDDIIEEKIPFTDEAFRIMSRTVGYFQTYCTDFIHKGVNSHAMIRETVPAFRRIRKLPEHEDAAVLQKILGMVPEQEGGKKEGSGVRGQRSEADLLPTADDEALISLLEEADTEALPEFSEEADECESADLIENGFADTADTADLPESFYTEAEKYLQEMGQSLSLLESQITGPAALSPKSREIIRQISLSVHSLKEASESVGLSDVSDFALSFENLLKYLHQSAGEITPETTALLSESGDLLESLVAQPQNPQTSRVEKLKKQFEKIRSGVPFGFAPFGFAQGPLRLRSGSEVRGARSGASPRTLSEAEGDPERSRRGPLTSNPISKIPPELLESFYEEAEEHLQDLGRSLNILESQITAPAVISPAQKEVIRQVRRSVHTLKGASAVVGLPNIPGFAHSFEDLLDWLYETAEEITPEIVSVLASSADLLERIVTRPDDARSAEANAFRAKYRKFMGMGEETMSEPESEPEFGGEITLFSEELPVSEMACPGDRPEEDILPEMLSQRGKTIRVSMDRVDELVNLVGELIIALSGFDQRMDAFMNTLGELDLSRDRLRDIARDMEVGYEVRSLSRSQAKILERIPGESGFEDFDSLELDRYSELNLIIRTLNESVIDVGAIGTNLANVFSEFDGRLNRQRVLLSELQNKMMRVRMTPMRVITNRLRQTLRETAAKLGKKIRLLIEGEDIELDRVIWEKITDPLMHLLRNAADHGIEPPELRQALRKRPVATVKLVASREGNQVVIRIMDDGAGLNYEAIRNTVIREKLSDRADQLSEEELAAFIFQPGFSTRRNVSEISGRGVGMDVVKENIQELKGVIRVAAREGKGTQFTIRIPMTLAAVRALLFTVSGQLFAIALGEIKEIIRISPEHITHEISEAVRIGNEILPLYYLSTVLNIRNNQADNPEGPSFQAPGASEYPIVLVVEAGGQRGALVIDALAGQREIVIKSTGSHLRYVRGIAGVTIMGDGSVVPILNIEELFRTETVISEQVPLEKLASEKSLQIMVVDDSVSIRQVVSRLMEDQGWKVAAAKDGIDALERLRVFRPDLIVLDIEMPRMNGYEFLSAVRAESAYSGIPVIMLTSRTASKHRDKAIALGARGFIVKPYNADEFVNLVLRLTGG